MQPFSWYFTVGGPLMWPLLACAVLALGIVIERSVRLRRSALIDTGVVETIQKLAEAGDTKLAVERYRNGPSAVGKAIGQALDEHHRYGTPIEAALAAAGEKQLAETCHLLGALATIAKVAPLIGLLGTVFGMIDAFDALQKAGVGRDKLIGAIRMALATTAAGLTIAVPTIIALGYFRHRILHYRTEFAAIFHALARSVRFGEGKKRKTEEVAAEIEAQQEEDRFELPAILSGKVGV